MKNLILLGLILSIACAPTEKSDDIFFTINEEVLQNSQAYADLKEETMVIGHRLTGSENGKRAEQYIYDKFIEYGFADVKFQEFEVDAWSRETISVMVTMNDKTAELKAVSLGHSPVEADVSAEIVDMGNGLVEDYEEIGDKLNGKIALVYISILPESDEGKKNLHRSEKAELAIQHGAAGVVIFNQVPNGVLLTGTASVSGELLPVPAICIGYEDGLTIKESLSSGSAVSTSIKMTNYSGAIKARNVIATLPGTENPDEVIVLGGHLDSWDLATGAIDNGIGSFAVLDIARTFIANSLQPKRTTKFVLFMGEEQGLLGSRNYVAESINSGEIDKVKFMMNLDMSGNPIGINISSPNIDTTFFPILNKRIVAVDTVYKGSFGTRAGLHSDHQPFMLQGIPIISVRSNLDRSIYRCYHADCDDFSLVNEEHIRNTTRFGSMILYGVANAEKLPAPTLSSEATKAFMIANGLEENLRMQGDWHWD
jgi:Iap family predicted aminopeptidase